MRGPTGSVGRPPVREEPVPTRGDGLLGCAPARPGLAEDGQWLPAVRDGAGRLVPDVRSTVFGIPDWVPVPGFVRSQLAAAETEAGDGLPYEVKAVLHFSNGVVSDAELPGAVAVNQARNSAAYLSGPFAGGLLYYLAPAAPFLVDAATFGLSLLGFLLIRTPLGRPERTGPVDTIVRDIGAGVAFLWRNAPIRWTLVVSSIMNCAFTGILFTVLVRGAGSAASGVSAGFVIGCAGAGSLLGSLLAVRAKDWAAPRTIVVAVTVGCALLGTVLVGATDPLAQAAVLFACACLAPTMTVVVNSGQMLLTPDELQGRMQSATSFLAIGCYPLGPVLAGVLLVHGSPALAFLAFSVLLGTAAVLSATQRSLRALPDLRSPVQPDLRPAEPR